MFLIFWVLMFCSQFDTTPGIFDNDIFIQTLKGNCRLNTDCNIAKDPELRPYVELFACNQTAFFEQYPKSYLKLTTIGQNPANFTSEPYPSGPGGFQVHSNLLMEGGPNGQEPATPAPTFPPGKCPYLARTSSTTTTTINSATITVASTATMTSAGSVEGKPCNTFGSTTCQAGVTYQCAYTTNTQLSWVQWFKGGC
ncbi:heme peroxidase [Chytriomyces sp. MP71]|nr:heme peroxidase [Chytriomyces sp. MP71]